MMKVICISGKAQHGKDTVAKFMSEKLEAKGYSVLTTHFGDLLKYICKTFFAWNGVKDEYGRGLLQYVGTDTIRAVNPDYWVNFLVEILSIYESEWDYVLIPDTRFPNEYEGFKDGEFDATLVRVTRPDYESSLTPEQQQHLSETAMDDYAYDYTIVNDGDLNKLQASVEQYIDSLIG